MLVPPAPIISDAPRRAHPSRILLGSLAAALLAILAIAAWFVAHPERAPARVALLVETLTGANPQPIHLLRPTSEPLSTLALLGKQIFHDPTLSASGRQSCASCHDPSHSYGPADRHSVEMGGPAMKDPGFRPPPTLTYLYRGQPFSIGPDLADVDVVVPLDQLAAQAKATPRAIKTAGVAPAAPAIVPQGGVFWDGRADTLMSQASGPLLNPVEMANRSVDEVARKLSAARYRDTFTALFGPTIWTKPALLVDEAMSAVSRYQIEDRSFHRFDSKYDYWLEGKVRLSPAELRGLRLFNDPARANCAGCHLSQATPDGLPPLFTDSQYEALGVPRNRTLPANRDARFFDLGLCGPFRTDLARQTQYCGMFKTPTLRNTASRGVYFHNGVYHDLKQVMDFYNLRAVAPERIYPHGAAGHVLIYDDIPARYHANLDTADAPFDRRRGDKPPLTQAEIADVIAFLHTLDDGFEPGTAAQPQPMHSNK